MTEENANTPQHWVRQEIRELSAYHVPDASGFLKLDAMENPYTWPMQMQQLWLERLGQTAVNRYPDPAAGRLKEALRISMSIPRDSGVLLGNGSDEIIQILAMAFAAPGRCILSVDPGFVMYRMIATFCGMKYVGVPLRENDFSLDVPAILQAMDQYQPAVVFLAYPNNPTGNLFARDDVHAVIKAAPGLVVVDEAYAPFAEASFIGELGNYDNLVVMRTLSKMGLAGLRLGLLAGAPGWIDEFEKIRLPYNINTLTQVSAEFALEHEEVLRNQAELIKQQRQLMLEKLSALAGLEVFPSNANFILFRTPPGKADVVHAGLIDRKILIKKLHGASPVLSDCLRVTVGTEQENETFIEALGQLL